jgi:hypothetical protein
LSCHFYDYYFEVLARIYFHIAEYKVGRNEGKKGETFPDSHSGNESKDSIIIIIIIITIICTKS